MSNHKQEASAVYPVFDRAIVDAFIARHSLDEESSAKLRALPEDVQAEMVRTDMSAAQNASAYVVQLIRKWQMARRESAARERRQTAMVPVPQRTN